MKSKLLASLILFFCINITMGQELVNKTDEFSKREVIRTDWQKLISKGFSPSVLKYSFFKKDNAIFFDARIKLHGGKKVFAVGEGFEIIFLLTNGEKVIVKSISDVVSKEGGASDNLLGSSLYGATITYAFDNTEDLNKLKNVAISKVRVYTDEGYFENKVKSKVAQRLIENIEIITR